MSWALELRVRLRVGPFSIGAVKMSPRATNSARSPFGLSSKSSIQSATEIRDGRRETPSSGTSISIARGDPSRVSSTWSPPFSSNTIRRSPSSPGHRTSQVSKLVAWRVRRVETS